MITIDHDHHHHDHDHSELSETELRVRALETDPDRERLCRSGRASMLIDRGLRDQDRPAQRRPRCRQGLDRSCLQAGRCWTTPPRPSSTLGHVSRVGDHLVAVENTPQRHNMVVCTLCSCYPWEMLGLPPVWYKAAPYRSRAVKDPRGVLADFGVSLPKDNRDPRLGSDRRDALPGAADAARGHRGLERSSSSPNSSPATP